MYLLAILYSLQKFSGALSEKKHIFACRLSRPMRAFENPFGILTACWQIFHNPKRSGIKMLNDTR